MSEAREDELMRDWRRLGRPASLLGTAGLGMGIIALVVMAPRIEGYLAPVFSRNEIPASSVVRTGQRLCWDRVGIKLRDPQLTDVDATIDYISNKTGKLAHQGSPSLVNAESGEELTSDDTPPPGEFARRVCTTLSSHILPGQPVRLRQTAYYQSWTGLYDVPVTFPNIVLPADQAWVFSQRHDSAPTPSDALHAIAGPPPEAGRRAPGEPQDIVRSPDDYMRRQSEATRPKPAPAAHPDAIPLGDVLRNDDGAAGSVHMDTTLSPEDAARIEQSRQAHGDRSRRAALRRLIPRALDDEDRDALGRYDPGRR